MTLNNVDDALTPEPTSDPWADQRERTEDTGRASALMWGRPADAYFATAHAMGAALRKLRRRQRDAPVAEPSEERRTNAPRIGHCSECGRYATGWHRPCGGGTLAQFVHGTEEMDAYHDRLSLATKLVRRRRHADVPDEWREPPGYPNYLMRSITRELWRRAYEIVLPNGSTRRYPAKVQTPANGSYSLSVGGVKSSRGIQALWNETFGKRSKKGEVVEPHRSEWSYYHGLAEWLNEDRAHIVTRP